MTLAYLRECFEYEADTGWLRWKHRPESHFSTLNKFVGWNTRYAGTRAGCRHKAHKKPAHSAYIVIKLDAKHRQAHRIIWALCKEIDLDDVPEFLDHRDVDGTNNRLDNLRAATRSENGRNTVLHANNTTGFKNVVHRHDKGRGDRYETSMVLNQKRYFIGSFYSAEEASEAYKKFAANLHGDFARFE